MGKEIKKSDRILCYYKYKGKCAYCGIDMLYEQMQVDHIVPLFRGYSKDLLSTYNRQKGKNNIDNYNPSCKSCNSSKSTLSIEEWRKQIKRKVVSLRRDVSNFRILERFGVISVNNIDVKFYFEKESEVDNG
jgi:5-methylcytosine-specific restriction endonuclease McrA